MMKFAIAHINFFDNSLELNIISAESERDALAQALNLLTGIEDTVSNAEQLKEIAFDCDGMINAIAI